MPSDRFGSAAELETALSRVLEEYGVGSAGRVLGEELDRAGLVSAAPSAEASHRPSEATVVSAGSLRPVLRVLLVCSALIVVGGAGLQYLAMRSGTDRTTRRGSDRLELMPPRAAYLRVVADPWAHVIVDGQHVDTTPFAESIPLRAGTHYVRLEHPNAPTERRTVQLAPGETALLDVKMSVEIPASSDDRDAATPAAVDAGDAASDAERPSP
jgi:serine/threonine-protein kinase